MGPLNVSSAESDGIAEMLEGGHRAVLTGVQRWLELVNRGKLLSRRQYNAQSNAI